MICKKQKKKTRKKKLLCDNTQIDLRHWHAIHTLFGETSIVSVFIQSTKRDDFKWDCALLTTVPEVHEVAKAEKIV